MTKNYKNDNIIYLHNDNTCDNIKVVEFRELCKKYEHLSSTIMEEYDCQIISFEEVREKREKMKNSLEKAVLEIHTAPITQGSGKDKRWFTPIRKGGKRVILKKYTYEALLDELINFYGIGTDIPTLRNLYPKWVKYKLTMGATTSYIRRIDADWRNYYINDPIVDKDIRKLSINEIRAWLGAFISERKLTSKKFYNMQTIFKQIFAYAYDEDDILTENPFNKISFPKRKYFKGETSKVRRMTRSKKEVFTEEDIKKVKVIAMEEYLSNPRHTTATASLGVLLLFQTGLRVGELVALRERNVFDDYIYVEAEEQRDYQIIIDEGKSEVTCVYKGTSVGAAKTDAAYRQIPLTEEAKYLIDLVRQSNKNNGYKTEDFLFVNAKQRMQENTILKHIYKYCDRAFIDRRSPHKVRKTFASLLINNGLMDLSEVAGLMGHVDEKTLINHYLYSTQESSTKLSRMEKSLVI